jgi:hypothetical protein
MLTPLYLSLKIYSVDKCLLIKSIFFTILISIVPQDIREFIDLSETKIYVQSSIRDQNDKKIPKEKHVGCINYLLGSLFKRVSGEYHDQEACWENSVTVSM